MKNKFLDLLRKEDGYGTVEMLLIIAGIGFVTTAIFNILAKTLAGEETGSAVKSVGDKINGIIEDWSELDPETTP